MNVLDDTELNEAFDHAFDKPIYLDHKPTPDEILTIRLRAVSQATIDKNKGGDE